VGLPFRCKKNREKGGDVRRVRTGQEERARKKRKLVCFRLNPGPRKSVRRFIGGGSDMERL